MNIHQNSVIGQLVADDYRAAAVFKRHKIDFCCQGSRTIGEACAKRNSDVDLVISELNEALRNQTQTSADFQSWPIDLLADYIEKKHHRYVEQRTMEIQPFLDKICRVHGGAHQELWEIKKLFDASAGDLAMHMKKEELVLFPYVRKMVQAQKEGSPMFQPHFGTVLNPIATMKHEHENEGERFRKIDELSNGYAPPEEACNTYRVTFAMLKEFEEDLHQHIHLENNILFPGAEELERKLLQLA